MQTYNTDISPEFEQQMLAGEQGYTTQSRVEEGALVAQYLSEYKEAETAKQLTNDRLVDDLRQYKGQYDAKTQARLAKSKRSKVFYRLTTSKVKTMQSRLMDLLFPQRSKNWTITPTPAPEIPMQELMQAIQPELQQRTEMLMQEQMQSLMQQNIVPDELALEKLATQAQQAAFAEIDLEPVKLKLAQERAAKMEKTIDDQTKDLFVNGQTRKSWQEHCRKVVFQSCLYGTGILKGPLIQRIQPTTYVPDDNPATPGQWREVDKGEAQLMPYYESVSVWDIFPDPAALKVEQLRYIWQRHVYTDKALADLITFPGFDGEAIKEHMAQNPSGDARLETWEQSIREINPDNTGYSHNVKDRYIVYERWGYIRGRELQSAGVDVPEERLDEILPSTIWILGSRIIKAAVNPIEGLNIPYHFYFFQEDETSFWSEGIASLLRHAQSGVNSTVRAMQDNSAAASGPIYGINMAHLSREEDPYDMIANRVLLFQRSGVNVGDVLQTYTVPSNIEHNLTLQKFWQENADEVSTPRFNAGDGNVKGAGETASGLSMLMGASNILLKDQVKVFDDHIIAPFIRAMFRWNMQFNPDESIKGDFNIVASGSQSLIAKEVRAQQVPVVMGFLANPAFAPHIKERELLEVSLEQTDLPSDRILRTKEEAEQYIQQQMMEQAMAQAQASLDVVLQELQKMGATPEQIKAELMAMAQGAMQMQAQAAQTGGMAA